MDILTTGTDEKVVVPDPTPEAYMAAMSAGGTATTAVGYAQTTQTQQPRLTGGQQFEGMQVGRVITKISGSTGVEMGFEDVSIDDRVRLCGEFRVVKVNHYAGKDGVLVREQVLAPLADQNLQLVPFDSTNPNDNGIVRMR